MTEQEQQPGSDGKTRVQDWLGLGLGTVGVFFTVSIFMSMKGEHLDSRFDGLMIPVQGLSSLIGSPAGFVGSLGTAVLGAILFLRNRELNPGRHLLGIVGVAGGVSLAAGGILAGAGGALGAALPDTPIGVAGRIAGAVIGLAVLAVTAWITWGGGELKLPERSRVPRKVQRTADREQDDGVSAAEAAALVPEPPDPFHVAPSRSALPKTYEDVRLRGGIPAGTRPLEDMDAPGAMPPEPAFAEPRPAEEPVLAAEAPAGEGNDLLARLTEANRRRETEGAAPGTDAPSETTVLEPASDTLGAPPTPGWETPAWSEEPVAEIEDEPVAAAASATEALPEEEPADEEEYVEESEEDAEDEEEYEEGDEEEESDEEEYEEEEPGEEAHLEEGEEGEEDAEDYDEEESDEETETEEDSEEEYEEDEEDEEEYEESEDEAALLEDEEDEEDEEEDDDEPAAPVAAKPRPKTASLDQPNLFDLDGPASPAAEVDAPAAAEEDYVLEPRAGPAPEEDVPEDAAAPAGGALDAAALEEVVHGAGLLILEENRVAVSMLERKFAVDFDQACRILDVLQERGLIGPYMGGRTREILMTQEEWLAVVAEG